MGENETEAIWLGALTAVTTRRYLLVRGAALGLAISGIASLLAACGGSTAKPTTSGATSSTSTSGGASSGSGQATTASGTAAAQAKPVSGGELKIIQTGDEPKLLDAHVDPFGTAAQTSAWLSDRLVFQAADGTFYPMLADKWEVSSDGLTWTFTLRKDVKFHDGTPFNAQAAKFNIDRIMDPKTQSGQAAAEQGPVKETQAVDDATFKVTHSSPYPPYLDSLSHGYAIMWSPTAVQKYGPDEYQRHLTGTGPWMLKEYKPAEYYTFVKNPDYNWAPKYFKHQGPPYIDTITLRWIKENATAVASFKAGEANVVLGFPPANAPDFRNDSKYSVISLPYTGSPVLLINNVSKAPLDDIKVRQAMEHAINSQEIVKVLTKGEGVVTRSIMYPASKDYWKDGENVYPFDPEKGKALLKDAGWTMGADGIMEKGGQKLSITTVIAFNNDLGPIVQAQLKAVGVDAKIENVPGPVQLDRAVKGDFHQMYLHFAYTDPGVLDILWNSKNNKPGGWSWSRYKDDKLDGLLNEAQQTVDEQKRGQLFIQAQQIIVNQALALPLYGNLRIIATTNKVKGIEFGPRPNTEIYDAYVEK